MGKQGPCRHCGVTSTPLWRNGPPEKPVLCNACGSRWRTKGSLANYTPLHVREVIESEDIQPIKSRNVTIPVSKTTQFRHQKEAHRVPNKKPNAKPRTMVESNDSFSGQNFKRASEITDWNSNTRSSSYSGSGATYSESCAHYDASDFTGSSQSNMCEPLCPTKKQRSGVPRPQPTRVEQLTKDLYNILHQTPLSSLSATSEDLVYPAEILNPMDSTDSIEIGSGSILILNSNSKSQSKLKSKLVEEESEASSVPTDVNLHGSLCVTACHGSSEVYYRGERNEAVYSSCMSPDEKGKSTATLYAEFKPKPRDLLQREKQCTVRVSCDSLLPSLDLKEIINFECYSKLLTRDEQQQLCKYLSPADSMLNPTDLRSLFSSSHIMETLNGFQKLVKEELFNPSLSGINPEEWKSLRRLVLNNPVKSEWVHSYEQIKDQKSGKTFGKMLASGSVSSTTSLKRPHNTINYDRFSGPSDGTMRSPKSIPYSMPDTNVDSKVLLQPNPSIISKRNCSLFLSPPDKNVIDLPVDCCDDFSNEEVLLDIPRNSSFPEAELLKVIPNEESQSSCGNSIYRNKQPMLKS